MDWTAILARRLMAVPILMAGPPGLAQTQTPDLHALSEFAKEVCKDAPLESKDGKTELSAEAKAKLGGFLKYLTDSGADVSAKHSQGSTYGVPQDQLAASIANSNDCRKGVVLGFKDAFVVSPRLPREGARGQREPLAAANGATGRRIGYGPFAVGDTTETIRQSGVSGQFGVGADGKTKFAVDTMIPIRMPAPLGESFANKPGTIVYNLDGGVVVAIGVVISEPRSCAQANWLQPLLSQTIKDLGEPTEGPKTSHETSNLWGQTAIKDITEYEFQRGEEHRTVGWIEATNPTNMSQHACIAVVSYSKA